MFSEDGLFSLTRAFSLPNTGNIVDPERNGNHREMSSGSTASATVKLLPYLYAIVKFAARFDLGFLSGIVAHHFLFIAQKQTQQKIALAGGLSACAIFFISSHSSPDTDVTSYVTVTLSGGRVGQFIASCCQGYEILQLQTESVGL